MASLTARPGLGLAARRRVAASVRAHDLEAAGGALLAARARHLGARPSFVAHPVRHLAAALRH